jgi:pseudouridine synthase
MERVQKIIANAGVASRREAEAWVADGKVTVNGAVATLGDRADPETDDVRVEGRALPKTGERLYLALNKPKGYTTTRSDPHAEHIVMELLKDVPASVYPVGRLDRDTEGLLLFTNDGEFANRLTHPRYKVPKLYEALVEGQVERGAVRALQNGVELEDGLTLPAEVKVIGTRPAQGREEAQSLLRITLREGRKRQVRRMCEAVGHPVLELRRLKFGSITLDGLEPGQWRSLATKEVWRLLEEAKGEEEPNEKRNERTPRRRDRNAASPRSQRKTDGSPSIETAALDHKLAKAIPGRRGMTLGD